MNVLETVLKWLIPFLCVGAVSAVVAYFTIFRAIRNGVQCLLRAEIIRNHNKYNDNGYCPIYAKEALKRAYAAYHNLGGNDVATGLYNEVMALPTEPPHNGGDAE